MNQNFNPNKDYILIHWHELEAALNRLAAPDKLNKIRDGLAGAQAMQKEEGRQRAIFHLVALIAWLTDPETCCEEELPNG